MGVKNPKNFTPKLVLDTNSILKSVVKCRPGPLGEQFPDCDGCSRPQQDVSYYIKSTLRYQKNFYTRDMSHMGACFWK